MDGQVTSRSSGSGGSQAIDRALSVLRILRAADGDIGVTDLSRAVELTASTTHRILRALVAAGYVAQHTPTERYGLGRQAFLLGRAAAHSLGIDAAAPVLHDLTDATGESVNLVLRDGDSALVVLRVESPHPLRFVQPAGTRIPLYCTSTGKAILAFSGELETQVAGLGELSRLTPTTLTSPRDLLRDLQEIRARGYSINRAERVPGVFGIAAPVRGPAGRATTAALALQAPEVRLSEDRINELGPQVIAAAHAVAQAFPQGYAF